MTPGAAISWFRVGFGRRCVHDHPERIGSEGRGGEA